MAEKKQKICLAIGKKDFEDWIQKKLDGKYDFTKICNHKGMVLGVLQRENPDIIILRESLVSNAESGEKLSTDWLVTQIKSSYNCRIILVAGEHKPGDDFLQRIISRNVYDIVYGKTIDAHLVLDMIENPRDYSSVVELQKLETLSYDMEDSTESPTLVETITEEKGSTVKEPPKIRPTANNNVPTFTSAYTSENVDYDKMFDEEPQSVPDNTQVPEATQISTKESQIDNIINENNEPENVEELDSYRDEIEAVSGEVENSKINELTENDKRARLDEFYKAQNAYIEEHYVKNKNTNIDYSEGTTVLTAEMMDEGPAYEVYGDDTSVLTASSAPLGIIFKPAVKSDFAEFENHEKLIENAKGHVHDNPVNPNQNISPLLQNKVLYNSENNYQVVPWTNVQARRCRVTVFTAARQGVGCTTTAINTAIALSMMKKKVLLIDGVFGKSCIYEKLGLPNAGKTLEQMQLDLKEGRRSSGNDCVNKSHMNAAATNKITKVRYDNLPNTLSFLRLSETTNYSTCNADMLSETINSLSPYFDHVIVDTSLMWCDELTKGFINMADDVLVVTLQDVYELNSAKNCIDFYNTSAPIRGKMTCIVNRFKKVSPDTSNVAKFFSISNVFAVPEDTERILKASSSGLPYYNIAKRKTRAIFDSIAELIR